MIGVKLSLSPWYHGGMKFRKLRITWSMTWGVLALLLIVLWVRSYSGQFGYLGYIVAGDREWHLTHGAAKHA